jgi:predicted MPP superfamily phosphohydrolase
VFALAISFCIYGIYNARILHVTEVKISLPNLPKEWKNRVAVMLSDIHLGHVLKNGFAKKIVNKISSITPDIVFIVGDFFDGDKADFTKLANEFKILKPKFGIFYVSGNHELYAGYAACEQAIRDAGINILEDSKLEIQGVQILGTAYREDTQEEARQLLKNLQFDKSKPSIYLKHVPSHITVSAEAGVSLQLSGHTHLGQIWPGRYFTKKVFNGFDYGLKALNGFQAYISSGAGTWGPPMRTLTKSEIVKITFT